MAGVRGWRNLWEFLADLVLEVGGDEQCNPVRAAGWEGSFGGFDGRDRGAAVGFLVAVRFSGDAGAGDGYGDNVGVGGCRGGGGAQGQDEGQPLGFGEHGWWSSGGKWWFELVVGKGDYLNHNGSGNVECREERN